ncbi:MAG: DedA family protein [Epsilonproteobacteria bacterium]|nr:DedA family protein [Campylobacterota bacterium]
MLGEIVHFIVDAVESLGYAGIFIMMFLESSFFPFPSEVAMIPAGYLAAQGKMNLFIAIFTGIAGSLAGALFNYFLAIKFGRGFLLKYGKYFFIKEETITKTENFFKDHGAISTFTGRLIPAVRQYISFPAGLAKMDLKLFSFYTVLGAGLWVIILTLIGYFFGANEELAKEHVKEITVVVLGALAILIAIYVKRQKRV